MTRCGKCKKWASFGKPGTKDAEFCRAHAPPEYLDVVSRRCAAPNCDARPSFGKPGTKDAEFCRAHAPPEYLDVKHKRC
ncbi:MAG: hypothetical protein ACYCOU_11215, partial [Sulfobacillus sp.]